MSQENVEIVKAAYEAFNQGDLDAVSQLQGAAIEWKTNDRVLVLAYQWATGKASGVPVELHFGQIWEFRDGKVIRIRNYIDEDSAIEAAGLRE